MTVKVAASQLVSISTDAVLLQPSTLLLHVTTGEVTVKQSSHVTTGQSVQGDTGKQSQFAIMNSYSLNVLKIFELYRIVRWLF